MSRLRCYFNWLALDGLSTAGLGRFAGGAVAAIRAAGYDGIQFVDPVDARALAEARACGLGVCGSGRVNLPSDAGPFALAATDAGLECLTLHVGWGMESDDEGARLIEAVLDASERYGLPLYVETHRATLFQDMQRAVEFTKRFPELRFNGDFSHWYTGQEMVYGGFEKKLEFIAPVVERVRFVHGRIGTPGCMQVAITKDDPAMYVGHFSEMWTRCFAAYLRDLAPAQEFVTFAAELLAPEIFYARTIGGHEESDRWEQSLLLVEIARECFAAAERTRG
jgi:hypothetical protein